MPRQARIDAPGALHHIICRGIERRPIFRDDKDRDDFVRRLSTLLLETNTRCYAWALIPNHFHLLLKTGGIPIALLMQKLLTGYAVSFNRRHGRHGHLFQNRYKSILCQEDTYLLQLVRYIHLNPLKAHIVTTLEELKSYRYCGHRYLLDSDGLTWQGTKDVLACFATTVAAAKNKYQTYLEDAVVGDDFADLSGGGLLRSTGGWEQVKQLRDDGIMQKSDERILGDSEFVEMVLHNEGEKLKQQAYYYSRGIDFSQLSASLAEYFAVDAAECLSASKKPAIVKVRSLLCFLAVRKLGMTATAVAVIVNMTQPAVSRSVERGREIAENMGLKLQEIIKV
jgi:putative transposase